MTNECLYIFNANRGIFYRRRFPTREEADIKNIFILVCVSYLGAGSLVDEEALLLVIVVVLDPSRGQHEVARPWTRRARRPTGGAALSSGAQLKQKGPTVSSPHFNTHANSLSQCKSIE